MGSSSRPAVSIRADAIISLAGGSIGTCALAFGPFVWFRPNRVVEGISATAMDAFGRASAVALALWLAAGLAPAALAVYAWAKPRLGRTRSLTATPTWATAGGASVGAGQGLVATGVLALLLWRAGEVAAGFVAEQGAAARTSFGWSFYLFLFALFLMFYAALAAIPARTIRFAVVLAPLLAVVLLASLGALNEIGIVREWTLTRSTFGRELGRHLFYALGATLGAVVIGVPLGILCARSRRAETVIMSVLNLGQVLPVLAFVGVMIPILGALSDRLAGLRALGISGIGWAPVMVVLLIYALFPVTRNTLVAIRQLDPAVLDTATGMGMGRWRSLREVELPLAFPVVLAGIRIALVQSTAGAIIAAFVGGGGLGSIMFMGLEQTSMDLVLVGVLPIVAMALFFDTVLRVVERLSARGMPLDPELSEA